VPLRLLLLHAQLLSLAQLRPREQALPSRELMLRGGGLPLSLRWLHAAWSSWRLLAWLLLALLAWLLLAEILLVQLQQAQPLLG